MQLIITILFFIVLGGAMSLTYQFYKIIVLDAKSRGLKHPHFWGLFSLSGQEGGGGIIFYLLGRKRYSSCMTDELKLELTHRTKFSVLSFLSVILSVIGLILLCF